MSLIRCAICHKAGLEEDFVYVPVDDQHERLMCYECAPEDAMKQHWPVDDEDSQEENASDTD